MKQLQKIIFLILVLITPMAIAGSGNPLGQDFEGTLTRNGEVFHFKGIKSFNILKGDVVKVIKGALQLSYAGCQHLSLNSNQMVSVISGECGIPLPLSGGVAGGASAGGVSAIVLGGGVAAIAAVAIAVNNSSSASDTVSADNDPASPR